MPPVRIRPIEVSDIDAACDVLAREFPYRPRKYWTRALETLGARESLPDCPQFGYLLEAGNTVVGVHLLIYNRMGAASDAPIRCNTSAWCVDPEFRSHAALLATRPLKLKHVTYLNTTASTHTWPILEALGYRRYTDGQFVSVPALTGGRGKVARLADRADHRALPEYALLRAHAEAGCLALVCERADGLHPFLFMRRRIAYAPLGVMQLMYCRDTDDFVRCAGPLGRALAARRAGFVICSADGPLPGLVGRYFPNKTPCFFKGPERPRPNDLAFTEAVLFGA
jgi:hypothetical protein